MESILQDTTGLISRVTEFKNLLESMSSDVAKAQDIAAGAREDIADALADIAGVSDQVQDLSDNDTLKLLPCAEGASWSSSQACYLGTRQTILNEIADFVSSDAQPSDKRIFLLTGVTGSGKTAIAHSVARHCARQNPRTLITSFMFDREVSERNNPRKLFSTIARDLSNTVPSIKQAVIKAIKYDNSLATAPLDRQFEDLILGPSASAHLDCNMTIVIDALDEGYSEELLKILSSGFADLPSKFRVVITSRSLPKINESLFSCDHIQVREIELRDHENVQDVEVVARERLRGIAEIRDLGEWWPTPEQIDLFIAKAEGLFIWMATVCNHLARSVKPAKQLNTLLSDSVLPGVTLTAKMDRLYAVILAVCPWDDDDDFAPGYQSLMGAIMALKTPLSVQVLHELLQIPNTDVQTMTAVLACRVDTPPNLFDSPTGPLIPRLVL